ncbi:YveK family protein [Liberiplasma polymorphum]|uniref:YveK family protein n=1 Tax=Liberiplasma polymorphum TaxID=3374570 RepID=UPI003776A684
MEENNNYEQELDLLQLIKILLIRWYIIVAATITVFGFTAFYSFTMLDDVYTAEGSMLVQVESQQGQSDAVSFQLGQRLVDTYTEIAKSSRVLNELRTNLSLPYTNSQLRNMITVTGVRDTIIIKLSVVSDDPEEAQIIANELLAIIQTLAASPEFQSLQNIDILDQAELPRTPSGPNRMLYLAIGIILGGMIGVFVVFIIEFLDRTVKTTKDVESKLGIRALGLIPDYNMEDEVDET